LDRRRNPRIRCNLPCSLRISGRSVEGRLCDVSQGGLRVRAELEQPEHGEPVEVRLAPPRSAAIEISALVWRTVGGRRASSAKETIELGLVLAAPSDAYFAFVAARARLLAHRDRPLARKVPLAPSAIDPGAAEPARYEQYAVRVKQEGGPRTCSIVVAAAGADEAKARALVELGSGWSILEVKPA
jgi:hypothetical protein